jgi:hypothetical protein
MQIEDRHENDLEQRRVQMISCMRICASTDLCWATTCWGLAAFVAAALVVMPLMCRAGALTLVRGARGGSTTRYVTCAQTDAVYKQREYSND